MKKIISVLIVLLLGIILSSSATDVLKNNIKEKHEDKKKQQQTENPSPVDFLSLSEIDLQAFKSNVPVVMMGTNGKNITHDEKTLIQLSIYDNGEDNDITGKPNDVLWAKCKLRGNQDCPKSQYKINLVKDSNYNHAKNYNMMNLGKDSNWILKGSYLDRSYLRDYFTYKLAKETSLWVPDVRFCELFVDGKYQGIYLMQQAVTQGESRLSLEEFGLLSGKTAYILKREEESSSVDPFKKQFQIKDSYGNPFAITFPETGRLTKAQERWIKNDMDSISNCLNEPDFDDPITGYAKYIDVPSFIDYMIINELAMNSDALKKNTYFYKNLGGKLHICPYNFEKCYSNNPDIVTDTNQFYLQDSKIFHRLCQDRKFVDALIQRYKFLRQGVLSYNHIKMILETAEAELEEPMERNLKIWGYTYNLDMLGENSTSNDRSYEQAVVRLKNTIKKRLLFLDEHIEELYEISTN